MSGILENKKAFVTGASRGIGRGIADAFLAQGAEVWGAGTKEPADLAERVEKSAGRLHWINLDLSVTSEIEKTVDDLVKSSGGFDIVVNNAGITKDGLSFRMTVEDFQKVLDVNLTAAFIISRVIGRDMIRRRAGSIINMSSVVGLHGNGGQANYAASKAAVAGMSKSLAMECAGRGVRVNAIAPGFIDSDMTKVLPEAVKEKMLERIPLKRMGTPEDVANLAVFLASDASGYITGQVITIDGGMFT